jgi:4-amino-4-deoxy-L-arabinose transferase-like glycosyltransferase
VREPFLILFTAVAFWSLAGWLVEHRRGAWAWMAGSLAGMGIFSPAVVLAVLLGLGVWTWLRRKDRHISRWLVIGTLALLLVAALLLGQIAGGTLQVPGGPLSNLVDWLRYSILYSSQVTAMHSGWLQSLFDILPDSLELPFITAYGIAQPVLPAAAADPAVWPVRLLGILRGLGWYALLPFLVYSLRPILKTTDGRERGAWTWLWLFTWAWIIVASARAGGDQWDNPRYRVILLLFQAFLAAFSLDWQRLTRDRWLGRILAVEAIFLVCFGYWYISRYSNWNMAVLNVTVVIAAILVLSAAVLLGGFLWDRRRPRGKGGDSSR